MGNEYQGFTNYQTYAVHMWLTNSNEQEYGTAVSLVNQEETVDEGAEALQVYVEENNPLSGAASMYSDLLQDALDAVNWLEIAEALWDEEAHEDDLDEDEYDEDYHRTGDVGEESEDA